MAERANITPSVLKWARETAKMTESEAADKISVKVERIIEWEEGQSKPTIKQAINLAKKYRRPFAVLFLPNPPIDFQPLQDFRKSNSSEISTATAFIIREIQQKQAWISEELKESGEDELEFVGKYSIKDNPVDVANDILSTLSIKPANYTTSSPLKEWIDKSEQNGIFISQASFIHSRLKINRDEIQGYALADNYAPFIFINSSDYAAPRLFTLVHELAHIWTANTGISNQIEVKLEDRDKYHPVELFCNAVAANALMPERIMKSLEDATFHSSKKSFIAAKQLGVSSFSLIYRAFILKIISKSAYKALKIEVDRDFEKFLANEIRKKEKQKRQDGGPSPYLLNPFHALET